MANRIKRHGISGKGHGKWQTVDTLKGYRQQRNAKKKLAKQARRRNRG